MKLAKKPLGNPDRPGNLIAGNAGAGIDYEDARGTSIQGNSIYANGGIGIDRGISGVTPNDAGVQNYPVLSTAHSTGGNTTITGTLSSTASTTFRIEFFNNPLGTEDPTGYGEGRTYLGFTTVTTDGSGDANINQILPVSVAAGDRVTATATVDLGGGDFSDTSEFAMNVIATSNVLVVDTKSDVSDGNTSSISALNTNKGADGFISLREAIIAANNTANGGSPDEIHFDLPADDTGHRYYADDSVAGQVTTANISTTTAATDAVIVGVDPDFAKSWFSIAVTGSELPTITDALFIDGWTQSQHTGSPIIEIDGSALSGSPDGFDLDAGNSTIRGLIVNSFGWSGIDIQGNDGNTIIGNYIGSDASGTISKGNNVAGIGISFSQGNTIGGTGANEGNLISGNMSYGILVESGNNDIQGNIIGLGASGTANLQSNIGIRVNDVSGNSIGGSSASQRNVISGNNSHGVWIFGTSATGNQVQGNYIGTDVTGALDLGNGGSGIAIVSAGNNTVGGTAPGAGNVISGNDSDGVSIVLSDAIGNAVQGNYIGTDATGQIDLGNTLDGVVLSSGASNNTIGGTTSAHRNIISGNDNDGIWITGTGTYGNIVQGNWIGLDVNKDALGNSFHGIGIENDTSSNLIGGAAPGAGNSIGHNAWDGITVVGSAGNSLLGNKIGDSGDLGIDLGDDVNGNDAGDGDTGANSLQNFPVITSAELSGTDLTLAGSLETDGLRDLEKIKMRDLRRIGLRIQGAPRGAYSLYVTLGATKKTEP